MKKMFMTVLFSVAAVGATAVTEDGLVHYKEQVPTPASVKNSPLVKMLTAGGQEPVDDILADFDVTSVLIDKIINLGQKVWNVIAAGEPVLTSRYAYANALPSGVRSSSQLDAFSGVEFASFRRYGKNGFGAVAYDVTYTVMHRHGGSFQGKGRYLDAVAVVPNELSLVWGYTMNVAVDSVNVANVGTAENPVASMLLELQVDVSTILKKYQVRDVYEFRGDQEKAAAKTASVKMLRRK